MRASLTRRLTFSAGHHYHRPEWDAARNAYIQYEPVSGQWMQFDDAAQEWRPLS